MKENPASNAPISPDHNYVEFGYQGYDEFRENVYARNLMQRSLKDYVCIIRERIWYLIVTFFIVFIGATLYTVQKNKEYTATAVVQMLRDDPTPMQQVGEGYAPNQILNSEDFNTQITILQSSKIVRRVEQRLKADELEEFMAHYKKENSEMTKSPAEVLFENRKISPQRLSLVIGISYTHRDPIIAAKIANLFAEEIRDYNLKMNIEGSIKAVEVLRARADQQRERVEELELQLAEYREENNAVSLDNNENIANDQLRHLNEIKSNAKNELDQLAVKWEQVEEYRKEGKILWELPFIATQNRVMSLLDQISQIKIQIASLSKQYREKHPVMIKHVQALEKSEAELEVAVDSEIEKLYSLYAEAKSQFEIASQRLAEKESELIQLSKTRVEYNSLLREVEVQQNFLQILTARMAEENAQVNFKDTNIRIIDDAMPPENPSAPNVILNIAAGAAGGLALGTGLILLFSFFDDRLRSMFDIEEKLGLFMMGVLTRIKKLDDNAKAQLVASNANRRLTEAFRSIYSTFKLNIKSSNAQVMLATSTVPGEGKSFICSNLALTFANHGEKTLLIDGDLRLPNVARSLQLKDNLGVLDCIEKDVEIDKVINREVFPNLDVISSGGTSKNPTQVFNSAKFKILMTELRDRYDRIIIDTPPLAAVSDALTLLPSVDGVLYVIKFNTVGRKSVAGNIRRILESNAPIFGAILNDIPSAVLSYYAQHRHYPDYYVGHDDDELEEDDNEIENDGDETLVNNEIFNDDETMESKRVYK